MVNYKEKLDPKTIRKGREGKVRRLGGKETHKQCGGGVKH
jgi:hypothetical protein